MRRFLPFAALLGVAFVLGCQDLGSGPVGPDGPQFDKEVDGKHGTIKPHSGDKDNNETATYTATFTDDVTGTTDNLLPPQGGKELMLSFNDDVVLIFTDFLQTADGYSSGEGGHCFRAGEFVGILQISSNTPRSSDARIQINFPAGDKVGGTTVINYTLILRGDFLTPEEWAPLEVGDMATINGGTFEVGPGGGPGDISCKGTGSVDFSLVVERTG